MKTVYIPFYEKLNCHKKFFEKCNTFVINYPAGNIYLKVYFLSISFSLKCSKEISRALKSKIKFYVTTAFKRCNFKIKTSFKNVFKKALQKHF